MVEWSPTCGAVVRLKSGGPDMTVTAYSGQPAGFVPVAWFNRKYELQRDCFHIDELDRN